MAVRSPIPEARPPCHACGYLADAGPGPLNFCPKCGQDLRPGVARAAPVPLLGHVVADRYRLLALLGEGGMGSVYKAEHVRMGKALAVKILRGDFARDPGAVARFRSEAQIVSRLSHPHTIGVFDFGEIEEVGGFYLAMEYVPGRDLAQVLRAERRFAEARAAAIGQQILGSLAEAHEAGVVHRDMKPGNVMLMQTRPGEDFAKVLDFGIAKLRDDGSTTTTTSVGAIVGTPSYLAPEQARGEGVDARADLYAVGCVLFELVGGRPPFVAQSPMAVVAAHLHDAPPSIAGVAPGTSAAFARIVHRALEKRPERRFQSADEMRRALLALGDPGARRPRAAAPRATGELRIARREDFREFERQVRVLRRSRIAAPLTALLLLAGAAALAWRWPEVHALVAARAPELAARIPAALRPGEPSDGTEREPNDEALQANALRLPPGPDGRAGGGIAVVRGSIGARRDETTGDTDVYRLVIPPLPGPKELVAEWRGERAGEGIRGLDVALALNRERTEGEHRRTAPLVASADSGGAGQPERLAAPVEPGVYYLTVRERHDLVTGPVEKPTDRYVLEVRLSDPRPPEPAQAALPAATIPAAASVAEPLPPELAPAAAPASPVVPASAPAALAEPAGASPVPAGAPEATDAGPDANAAAPESAAPEPAVPEPAAPEPAAPEVREPAPAAQDVEEAAPPAAADPGGVPGTT